jgi:hypothetical protein
MMCFRDMTFCCSKTKKHTCGREFTDLDQRAADKWWGKPGAPVAFANFCKEDETTRESNHE